MTWDNLQNKESKLPEISAEDQKMNRLFATVFKTDAGKEVLAYLKSIFSIDKLSISVEFFLFLKISIASFN